MKREEKKGKEVKSQEKKGKMREGKAIVEQNYSVAVCVLDERVV